METSLYPPNSILFIFDVNNSDVIVPEYIDDVLVASNSSCVSVGTQADVDGEVKVELNGSSAALKSGAYQKVFTGLVETPGLELSVVTSEFEAVLKTPVASAITAIEVWADDPRYPGAMMVVLP